MCKFTSFLEGMAIGVVAGVGIAVAGKIMMNNEKKMKKGKTQLERAVNEFIDGVQTMVK